MAIEYVKEGRLAIFTINRPEVGNALNMAAIHELHDKMVEFQDDPEVLVGIITGAGEKAFCTGADIRDTLPFIKEHRDTPDAFPPTFMRGLSIWKPLIAAINGLALGGGLELALACDLRIASNNARFGFPEVSRGLMPGWGGTQRLPRTISLARAVELIIMGRIIDAEEACRIGLVNKVVSYEELMPTVKEWAATICEKAPLATQAAKQALVRGLGMTLEDGLKLEQSLLSYLMGTADFDEGIRAFSEKRKPVYRGK
jgi:enoyl-CoA hydratase/carnithine racemase